MKLHQLKPVKESKKRRKRVGRGNASGMGTYSTRGMKGQKSRSGSSFSPGFEGGKTPLIKMIPKIKGFKSLKQKPQIISLSLIDKKFKDGDIIDKRKLKKAGIIKSIRASVKLVGNGETKKKFSLIIDKATKNAQGMIEKAGGKLKFLDSVKKNENKKDAKSRTSKK